MTEVSLEDLQSFMVEDSVLSSAFNTDVSSGDIVEVCRALKAKRTALSSELVAAIARLIAFLGMELHTSPAIIAKLFSQLKLGLQKLQYSHTALLLRKIV
ncbi:hypothetical protein E4T38_05986 [Aureobasidium subglaciale]|nr:hypothetical protein E4T38_05986 [Aureobasidium subglaciale]KAI5220625.1 hypothetical protein E4T40_05917 [Aureobasidium subglaciale]KAI5224289.1 hypothetical protein E4T41_05847 [Aureobasidium subglaciale]KAI5260760.1 hypothetical protein E4T46_05677 [Aureobasidium subglaciale]